MTGDRESFGEDRRQRKNDLEECQDKIDKSKDYFKEGLTCISSKSYEKALEAFNRAIELTPYDSQIWVKRGITLHELSRYNDALASFEKAIEINPKNSEYLFHKGVTLAKLGRRSEEIECLDKALELKNENLHETLNENKDQKDVYFTLSFIGSPDILNNKGIALEALNKNEEALKCFEDIISTYPNYERAWCNKGIMLLKFGRIEESIQCLKKAVELKPKFFQAWDTLGVAFYQLKKYTDSINYANKAIEIAPTEANGWFNRSCYYAVLGNKEKALENLKEAVRLDPKYKEEAKKDDAFENLWNDDDFMMIISNE